MEFFEIFAECSIALVGFGAVHAVLQGSSGPRGMFRAWTVVQHGAVAFILSIVPLMLDLATLSDDTLWRMAGVLAIFCAGIVLHSNISFDRRLARMGHPPQAEPILRAAQASSMLAMLASVSTTIGWPWSPGPLPYAIAPVFILVSGLLAMLHSFLLPLQLAVKQEAPDTQQDDSPDAADSK